MAGRPTSPRTTSTSASPRRAPATTAGSACCPRCPRSPAPSGTSSSRAPAPRSSSRRASVRFAYGQGTSFSAPIVVGHRGAHLAGRAAARLRAGRGGADPLGTPDVGQRLEPVHGGRCGRRQDGHRPGPRIRRDLPAREGQRATQRRARDRPREAGQGPQRVGARGGRARALRAAGLARRGPELQRDRQRAPGRFRKPVRLKGSKANVFVATACDGNGNCGVKRLGRFRR